MNYLEAWIQLDVYASLLVPHQDQTIECFNHHVDTHLVHLVWHIISSILLHNLKCFVSKYEFIILQNKMNS